MGESGEVSTDKMGESDAGLVSTDKFRTFPGFEVLFLELNRAPFPGFEADPSESREVVLFML